MSTSLRLPSGSAPIADAARLGTVLGIWAHPDDEAFLSAGLMAAARDAGNWSPRPSTARSSRCANRAAV
jgi:hypothetical protein